MSRPFYLVEGPPSESYTTVYVVLLQPNGLPLVNKAGYAKLLDLPYYTEGSYFGNTADDEGLKVYSNASGLMRWDLIQGARYRFTIPLIDIDKYVTLTATGLVSLGDL